MRFRGELVRLADPVDIQARGIPLPRTRASSRGSPWIVGIRARERNGQVHEILEPPVEELEEVEAGGDRYGRDGARGHAHGFGEDSGDGLPPVQKESPVHPDQGGLRIVVRIVGADLDGQLQGKPPLGEGPTEHEDVGPGDVTVAAHPVELDPGEGRLRDPIEREVDLAERQKRLEGGA
jgi:hypothetical protein